MKYLVCFCMWHPVTFEASSRLMKQWSKTTCKFEELWMGMDGGKPVVPNVLAIRADLWLIWLLARLESNTRRILKILCLSTLSYTSFFYFPAIVEFPKHHETDSKAGSLRRPLCGTLWLSKIIKFVCRRRSFMKVITGQCSMMQDATLSCPVPARSLKWPEGI